jgi:hypothetical protein
MDWISFGGGGSSNRSRSTSGRMQKDMQKFGPPLSKNRVLNEALPYHQAFCPLFRGASLCMAPLKDMNKIEEIEK